MEDLEIYKESWLSSRRPNFTHESYVEHMVLFTALYPLSIILNVILVFVILTKKNLRSDHSTWLILHTSLVALVFLANSLVIEVKKFTEDEWKKSVACHVTVLIDGIVCHVTKFSLALVSADRVRAIWHSSKYPQGFSKTTIGICLLVTWLVNIILFPIIYFEGFRMTKYGLNNPICSRAISTKSMAIYYLWPYLPVYLVIIWNIFSLVKSLLPEYKGTNPNDVKPTAVPTLVMDCFFSALYFPYMITMLFMTTKTRFNIVSTSFFLMIIIFWVVYPICWLLSSQIRREPCCSCCPKDDDEKTKLMMSSENIQQFTSYKPPAAITIKIDPNK